MIFRLSPLNQAENTLIIFSSGGLQNTSGLAVLLPLHHLDFPTLDYLIAARVSTVNKWGGHPSLLHHFAHTDMFIVTVRTGLLCPLYDGSICGVQCAEIVS